MGSVLMKGFIKVSLKNVGFFFTYVETNFCTAQEDITP